MTILDAGPVGPAAADVAALRGRIRVRPSQRHPWLLPWAVRAHRMRRRLRWMCSGGHWAITRSSAELPVRVQRHASVLIRDLSPSDAPPATSADPELMRLQHNKVVNLRLAAARTDGVMIRPGETFSFNKVVGSCTRRKGYLEGMRLNNGRAVAGVGGGICQLANLLHWMVLHSELTVVERSEHSFDAFPDRDRVLPWGVGCSIVYNYVDLVVRNDTATTYQLRTWVGERHLRGELRADREPSTGFHVEARDERFVHVDGDILRTNQIWRTITDRRTGQRLDDQLLARNCALVRYVPAGSVVHDVDVTARD